MVTVLLVNDVVVTSLPKVSLIVAVIPAGAAMHNLLVVSEELKVLFCVVGP